MQSRSMLTNLVFRISDIVSFMLREEDIKNILSSPNAHEDSV